ncbi:SurA N-terminal domain-containing protein [Paenisporosarcina sp. TG20]|uniref:SurA N-terminal domain-containing protein n=1 Tax=Paenisporosarcina sp. TG20 TaxID=1211706 RepID=UPI0002DB599E|nr:SurA N-terminal domain-containing protein [Paenisporosarcina sp. TG20]
MNFKRLLLPLLTSALALSLAACSEEEETTQKGTDEEQAAVEEMQTKLAEQLVDNSKVVAVVNGEELKGVDYNAAVTSVQVQLQQSGQDPTTKEAVELVKTQALNRLVNQTLILQKAKESNLTASDAEVDERYAAFEKQSGGEESMQLALEAQNMDVNTLKEDIAESIIFEKYQEKVVPADEITYLEVKAYYDQVAAQAKEADQELPPIEEVSEEIKGILEEQKQQELLSAHVEELKVDAEIDLKI